MFLSSSSLFNGPSISYYTQMIIFRNANLFFPGFVAFALANSMPATRVAHQSPSLLLPLSPPQGDSEFTGAGSIQSRIHKGPPARGLQDYGCVTFSYILAEWSSSASCGSFITAFNLDIEQTHILSGLIRMILKLIVSKILHK